MKKGIREKTLLQKGFLPDAFPKTPKWRSTVVALLGHPSQWAFFHCSLQLAPAYAFGSSANKKPYDAIPLISVNSSSVFSWSRAASCLDSTLSLITGSVLDGLRLNRQLVNSIESPSM